MLKFSQFNVSAEHEQVLPPEPCCCVGIMKMYVGLGIEVFTEPGIVIGVGITGFVKVGRKKIVAVKCGVGEMFAVNSMIGTLLNSVGVGVGVESIGLMIFEKTIAQAHKAQMLMMMPNAWSRDLLPGLVAIFITSALYKSDRCVFARSDFE